MSLFSAANRSLTTSFKSSLRAGGQQVRGLVLSRLKVHHLDIGKERRVAYKYLPGQNKPTVVMIPGLNPYTHMDGDKTACMLRYCDFHDFPCLVYDHECTGQSQGDTKSVMFSHWVEDAEKVIDRLTEGPVLLVGSSLGGWLSLLVAREMEERLHSLVLFSPALNYIWPYYNQHVANLPAEVRERLEAGDIHVHTHEFGNALLKKDFAVESRKYEIDLDKENDIHINCPVRIITSLSDTVTDPRDVVKLSKALKSDDVNITHRKGSTHQLDSALDFELFLTTVDRMLKDNPVRQPRKQQAPENYLKPTLTEGTY